MSDRETGAGRALPRPRFGRHQIIRAVIHYQLAEMLGAVLDAGEPVVRIVDHMPPGLPPERLRAVQPRIALLLDYGCALRDGCSKANFFWECGICLVTPLMIVKPYRVSGPEDKCGMPRRLLRW